MSFTDRVKLVFRVLWLAVMLALNPSVEALQAFTGQRISRSVQYQLLRDVFLGVLGRSVNVADVPVRSDGCLIACSFLLRCVGDFKLLLRLGLANPRYVSRTNKDRTGEAPSAL